MEDFKLWLKQETDKRKQYLQCRIDTHEKDRLFEDGCVTVRGAFSGDVICDLIDFQRRVESVLGERLNCSGYVDVASPDCLSANIRYVKPNYGQVRLQTKGMSFPMPGFASVSSHPVVKDIFDWYHEGIGLVTRGTMEWIVSSDLNHNGWHKDMLRPQLKCFVFLDDVDMDRAPMSFALKSHMNSLPFEMTVSERLYRLGTLKKDQSLLRSGRSFPGVDGAHTGYLGDDEAYNDGDRLDESKKETIGGNVYDIEYCTGRPGDICFFDSSGFHSGNKVRSGIRRTITISSPSNHSSIGSTLTRLGVSA
jgi:hypothetical protein